MFHHIYIAPGIGDKILMTTEMPFLFARVLQVSKWSLRNLVYTHFKLFYICIQPWGKGRKTRVDKLLISTESPYHFDHLLQVSNKSLWSLILLLYTHVLMFLHMYIAPGQGQTNLCGQSPDVNRKALSLCPFVASFKKYPWSLILYIMCHVFIHVYSTGAGADNRLGSKFLYKHKTFVTLVICCKFLPLNDFLTVFPI